MIAQFSCSTGHGDHGEHSAEVVEIVGIERKVFARALGTIRRLIARRPRALPSDAMTFASIRPWTRAP
ncbi:MAG: hypothetical protein ACR2LK_02780 [Solirubrobacteraceae bacterium]